MFDAFLYHWEMLWLYIKDFIMYNPEDIDNCCRR